MIAPAWYVPVNVRPDAMRWKAEGETRAIEPSEVGARGRFLPVFRWPECTHYNGIPVHLTYPNHFHVPLSAAHHYTSLGFPA